MQKVLIALTVTGCLALLSCNNGGKQQAATAKEHHTELTKTDNSEGVRERTVDKSNDSKEDDVLKKLPVRNFVITDSTNFDNYQAQGIADDIFIKKIKFKTSNSTAEDFKLRYKVPFSGNFSAVVITYRDGEHELYTTLVTLDKSGDIIDQLDIAYDEIAESAFSKIGTLEKDRISIQSWNYMNEVPTHEESIFTVLETGRFKLLK